MKAYTRRLDPQATNKTYLSVFCYIVLFFLTDSYSEGSISDILKGIIVFIIPLQLINGMLLFLGAVEAGLTIYDEEVIILALFPVASFSLTRKPSALQLALWVTLLLAAINTILGFIGAVYFIRMGFLPIHFVLSLLYALIAFSIFTVMCHDIIVIYTLKIMLGPLPSELTCVSDICSVGDACSGSCCGQ